MPKILFSLIFITRRGLVGVLILFIVIDARTRESTSGSTRKGIAKPNRDLFCKKSISLQMTQFLFMRY